MKILLLFASQSDEETYLTISKELDSLGIKHNVRIASAHKTPDKVEEIIKEPYDLVVSGAGLAAHLPGVIAAKLKVPIIGVPCAGAFDGLDSFLSIVQMPPGIPVLMSSAKSCAKNVQKITINKLGVVVTGEGKYAEKALNTLSKLGIKAQVGRTQEGYINIEFPKLGEKVTTNGLTIYCPIGISKSEDAIGFMQSCETGLWVGVNRADNAAIAAAEILGRTQEIESYRKELAEKIEKADEHARRLQ